MTYVLGFLFSLDMKNVVLIEKQRGVPVKGMVSGIGGRVEGKYKESLTNSLAMKNIFMLDTGLIIKTEDWRYFMTYNALDWSTNGDCKDWHDIYCYYATSKNWHCAKTRTDEIVHVVNVADLMSGVFDKPLMPEVKWMIQMCLSFKYDTFTTYSVKERR